ncbi:GFA family protein [uncultured Vibrio sp.]|uniref:GFA family protein n=1 Tax=uncultured Vibrio sp. TaxID=114054 RepID=UPI0025CFD7E6|nr:GFA family protein [uncultured Vibrio sp.]
MTYPISGSCQCGQLTFSIKQAPNLVLACHCKECQKLSTSPFSVTAVFPTEAIEFKGEMKEWSRSADSGNQNNAKFCPECGNRVYHYNPANQATLKLKLKPTELEDDTIFEPTVHVWVSEKQSWYQIPEGVRAIDTQP